MKPLTKRTIEQKWDNVAYLEQQLNIAKNELAAMLDEHATRMTAGVSVSPSDLYYINAEYALRHDDVTLPHWTRLSTFAREHFEKQSEALTYAAFCVRRLKSKLYLASRAVEETSAGIESSQTKESLRMILSMIDGMSSILTALETIHLTDLGVTYHERDSDASNAQAE